jgi:transcriptional regulator with XRE-family HTH domain
MPTIFERWLEEDKQKPAYVAEGLILELGEQIVIRMAELGINRAGLARRMGTSPAYITKILRGANVSLLTLAKIAIALECEPEALLGCIKRPVAVQPATLFAVADQLRPLCREVWPAQSPRAAAFGLSVGERESEASRGALAA